MLFSEPKIPQSQIETALRAHVDAFQCSSASRKFLNDNTSDAARSIRVAFSALQRAENSSILAFRGHVAFLQSLSVLFSEPKIPQSRRTGGRTDAYLVFQCSSASRKFLNRRASWRPVRGEPLSVLFSEPKIPQSQNQRRKVRPFDTFSALQRAENSSIRLCHVSSALNEGSFSALQRAENSSILGCIPGIYQTDHTFSALQRAENSSIRNRVVPRYADQNLSVLFSEPKIPQSEDAVL